MVEQDGGGQKSNRKNQIGRKKEQKLNVAKVIMIMVMMRRRRRNIMEAKRNQKEENQNENDQKKEKDRNNKNDQKNENERKGTHTEHTTNNGNTVCAQRVSNLLRKKKRKHYSVMSIIFDKIRFDLL